MKRGVSKSRSSQNNEICEFKERGYRYSLEHTASCLENFVNVFTALSPSEVFVYLKVLHRCNRNFRLFFFCFEEKP